MSLNSALCPDLPGARSDAFFAHTSLPEDRSWEYGLDLAVVQGRGAVLSKSLVDMPCLPLLLKHVTRGCIHACSYYRCR